MAGIVAALAVALTGCGAASSSSTATPARGSGPVDVLYAGSLLDLMQHQIAPAFEKESGDTVSGYPGGSKALAAQIKGGVERGDVLVSASPAVNTTLEGAANGNWVSWYAAFADSPLVLGYRPSSAFAHDLETEPWYEVVGRPGFRLGRTDPATDPKGALAVDALDRAAAEYSVPALAALAASGTNVFPETTLVGRMQAGQLDAAFFYGVEAAAAHIDTVTLAGVRLSATYTITILNRSPHGAGARAFAAFLLGAEGRRTLAANGAEPIVPPKVTGRSLVPASLKAALP